MLVEADSFPLRQRSIHGETPLHIFCRQKPTAEHVSALTVMLELASDVARWKDPRFGHTPLHSLCRSPAVSENIVHALIATGGGDAVGVTDLYHNTPLHIACEAGVSPAVIQELLQTDPRTAKA